MKATVGQLRRLIREEIRKPVMCPDMDPIVDDMATTWEDGTELSSPQVPQNWDEQLALATSDMKARTLSIVSNVEDKLAYGDFDTERREEFD